MIQHGAQEIILSCDKDEEDMKANLDEIISQSLKKTEEFEKKLKSIDEKFNLNSVSLTGDDDYQGKKKTLYSLDGEELMKTDKSNKVIINPDLFDIGTRKKI